MKRREFLRAAGAAGCMLAGETLVPGLSNLAFAANSGSYDGNNAPLLTIVFLRGGADGLHLVAPTADADYVAARPPELRIAESGDKAGLLLERSLNPNLGFRLHPEAAPLHALYQGKRMAVLHAIGLSDGTRSHFVAQDIMERGLGTEKQLSQSSQNVALGWLARAVPNTHAIVPAYAATSAAVLALHGNNRALSTPDISGGLGLPWGNATMNFLRGQANSNDSVVHRATQVALYTLDSVERQMPRDANNKILPYKPDGRANYDGAGELTRNLASVARLAKMDVGLRVACVDHGGWDTHEGQPGRFANQVKQLSLGLAAFHEDMAAANRPVLTIVMTEFGRRVRANKSGGTDHGHGACWLALGDGVRGGAMYGRWPGLSTAQMDQGVDLAVTTDYRNILAEALRVCALGNPATVFPEFRGGNSLGFTTI